MIRFKVDENLPVEVAELLRAAGFDSHTVTDEQLNGEPDASIARVLLHENRALMTLDLDFADIRSFPPDTYNGIVVLRPSQQDISSILRMVKQVIVMLRNEPLSGRLWIVDSTSVRIR
jgi:predicted nuclease of predicted toxin-antitoxin system